MIKIQGNAIAVRESGDDIYVRLLSESELPTALTASLGPERAGSCGSVIYVVDPETHKNVGVGCMGGSCSDSCEVQESNHGGEKVYWCACLPV